MLALALTSVKVVAVLSRQDISGKRVQYIKLSVNCLSAVGGELSVSFFVIPHHVHFTSFFVLSISGILVFAFFDGNYTHFATINGMCSNYACPNNSKMYKNDGKK